MLERGVGRVFFYRVGVVGYVFRVYNGVYLFFIGSLWEGYY